MNESLKLKQKLGRLLDADVLDYQSFAELSAELVKHDKENLRFVVDAGTITHLGKDSIKDHSTAIVELVKNSYDAGAKVVQIEIRTKGPLKRIRIVDNGVGMSQDDVIQRWLRIGFSEKRKKRHEGARRKTGEKGIGRISADRLGALLRLSTKAHSNSGFGLSVNWDDFDVAGKNLALVPFRRLSELDFSFLDELGHDSKTGTELVIESLRNEWNDADFKRLYEELQGLFYIASAEDEFKMTILSDAETVYKGRIAPKRPPKPEMAITVTYKNDQQIEYSISNGDGQVKLPSIVPWDSLVQYVKDVKKIEARKSLLCGPVSFEIGFYPRESRFARGLGLSLHELKAFLDFNGGVKIYRDNVSVKPYGFEGKDGEDWLNLGERHAADPAGIARETWSVLRSQLVGSVVIGRDENPKLLDSAGREGLIHNEAYYDLRSLVLAGIRLLEVHRHTLFKARNKDKPKRPNSKQVLQAYKDELALLREELTELKAEAELRNDDYVLAAHSQVIRVIGETAVAEKSIADLLNKDRTMSGLATVGISAAVFGHETQIAISHFQLLVEDVQTLLDDPVQNKEEVSELLREAVRTASRISDWGSFALSKVRQDKRLKSEFDVEVIVNRTLDDLEPAMSARTIHVVRDTLPVRVHSFEMDIEAILLNLLTNSYSACLVGAEPRQIRVGLHNEIRAEVSGFRLTVADTGPGVLEELREIIWEPLFTTKTGGEGHEAGFGLGLSIVQSIVDELNGLREVNTDVQLKGAAFSIWLPSK